jgi:hypothetical protein
MAPGGIPNPRSLSSGAGELRSLLPRNIYRHMATSNPVTCVFMQNPTSRRGSGPLPMFTISPLMTGTFRLKVSKGHLTDRPAADL